jgi:hypothetical protein
LINRITGWLKYVATYLAIAGLVTFSLFILEESFQTVMFGTWPAQDVQQWEIIYEGTEIMQSTVWTLKAVNYTVGYVQPIAFLAYRKFGHSADYYTKALRAKVFAHRPDLFINQEVSFDFTPREITKRPDGSYMLRNRKIWVICHENQKKPNMSISGVLKPYKNESFVIDIR